MYSLYFIRNDTEQFYGNGDMKFIMELLNDHLYSHDMYGSKDTEFRIERHEVKK